MLNTGSTTLVGGIASMLDSRGLRTGIGRGYTRESVAAGSPVQYNFNSELRPESSQTFEIGYKGLITKNLLIDTYYYGTTFKDFISTLALLRNEDANGNPIGGLPNASSRAYGTVVNDPNNVKSYGFGIGVDYLMDDFKISYNLGVSKTNLFKNVGAGLTYRWQDQFLWTSSFITGTVESFGTLDAQVNFRIPKQKLTMKVGGSNITNQYYRTNFGNPMVGAVYYVSFTFDQLMK
jgi:outer membrane receptor protein involved in Fe transport